MGTKTASQPGDGLERNLREDSHVEATLMHKIHVADCRGSDSARASGSDSVECL